MLLASVTPTVPPPAPVDELHTFGQTLLASLPRGTLLVATCGPSQGVGYYLTPKQEGWVDDPITKGRVAIIVSPTSEPNIFYQDAMKRVVNAKEEGAEIYFTFIDTKTKSFGLVEKYSPSGVIQTYVVSPSPSGKLTMVWTSAKAHAGPADITKVTAYASECE